MFKASDRVDYDNLRVNAPINVNRFKKSKVPSLVELSCKTIITWPALAELCIVNVPCHLAPSLLKSSIDNEQKPTISTLISNWPLTELCFRDILPDSTIYKEIFEEEMGFDLVVFRGIVSRKKLCKIQCVDLRGFPLNSMFCKLIVKMWPILSLPKSQLNPKKLSKLIAKAAGVETTRLSDGVLPELIKDILEHEMIKTNRVRIQMPRKQRMVVKLDSLLFTTGNSFFMDYLISNSLRHVTPVYIQTSCIKIRSDLNIGDKIVESLAPFTVLRGQDTQTLEGLSFSQLEGGIFFTVLPDVQKFTNLRFLDLQECSIYLRTGCTRLKSNPRNKIVSLFSGLKNLKRLDIGLNYLIGCLGEILEALPQPLEFLSLKGCDIAEEDLDALAQSKHAGSLRELYLNKLSETIPLFDFGQVSQHYLLKSTKHFPNLSVLSLADNSLPDSAIPEFCVTIKENLKQLKILDISANFLNLDSILSVVQTCAKLPSMQKISITCVRSLLDMALLPLLGLHHDYKDKIVKVLEACGRPDIIIKHVHLLRPFSLDFTDNFLPGPLLHNLLL